VPASSGAHGVAPAANISATGIVRVSGSPQPGQGFPSSTTAGANCLRHAGQSRHVPDLIEAESISYSAPH
ncbi:MAG: hypothetical protein M3R06_10895, partial [Chloroflexota bacterium]|nr:hypothetical protein [Chloroflexota bacterium]